MAYRFKIDELAPQAAKRVAAEELEWAVNQLGGEAGRNRDEAIHEARKSIKKIRSLLRLLQPELHNCYRTEASHLREVGRDLSKLRDAGAVIRTFDLVRRKYRSDLGKTRLSSLRRGLIAHKKAVEQELGIGLALPGIVKDLRAIEARVKTWPLETDGFPAIAPGLKAIFRRGRKALASARKQPCPDNFHEWRKRIKDLWYAVRLLEALWTDVMEAYEKTLKDLETWLGEDHDLVVLREDFVSHPDLFGNQQEIDAFLNIAGQYQKELRDNALSLGERVYEESPGQFIRRMKHFWDSWQAQPKALDKVQKQK